MLQFITNSPTVAGTVAQARQALRGGCKWIQVRMKGAPKADVECALGMVIPDCTTARATLIVDDHVDLAAIPGVSGVHLGQTDMPVPEARKILGPDKIIGLTINNMDHAKAAIGLPVDYFGIGPWRFTGTKANLAPILGPEGIAEIISHLRRNAMPQPVVAIGGITADDCARVLETGADGIAVSGIIADAPSPSAAAALLLSRLHQAELSRMN
ncbi:MAG: thiamine phosphate synthase [Muribaculaceae bacterium]|nr:thiamine phosphate synthase [Muribaculaceae bacterium]